MTRAETPWRRSAAPSLFGFAPGGVYHAASVAGRAVCSCHTLSPLPERRLSPKRRSVGRSAFCGTVPGVAPAGCYPAPCFRGARTFLTARLSALDGAAAWPTDAARVERGSNDVHAAKSPLRRMRSGPLFESCNCYQAPSRRLTFWQYRFEIGFIFLAPWPALYFRMVPQVEPPPSLCALAR